MSNYIIKMKPYYNYAIFLSYMSHRFNNMAWNEFDDNSKKFVLGNNYYIYFIIVNIIELIHRRYEEV